MVFTGIVEELGTLVSSSSPPEDRSDGSSGGARLVLGAALVLEGTAVGDSISVNGCCLTVVDLGPGWWAADVVAETLRRTNLGRLRQGDPVNLERSLSLGSRLGGHLVQGHVDAVGTITRPAPDLAVAAPDQVRRYLVGKGSITVDGVSLTVVSVTDDGFTVAVIPHTMGVTTLGRKAAGDQVNLETDVIAKYAERLLAGGMESPYTVLGPMEGSAP